MKIIKKTLISSWKLINNIIYFFIKIFKTKNKVTFISRQTNGKSLDFDLLIEEIKKQDNNIEIVVLNKMIGKSIIEKTKYAFYIYRQMYHIATSKAVVLDGYCIPICTLKHKKNLRVIQIWHALGSLKKFGYSILDKREGSKSDIALTMDMHKNYTYILTSSEFTKQYFMEAFNANEEQMKVIPLPRVDFLKSDSYKQKINEKFYKYYNILEKDNKKKILYVPTFRKNTEENFENIIDSIDYNNFDLIIKSHDDTEIVCYSKEQKYSEKTNFSGMELLHVADYVITDYSAIAFESAVANKPVYFYNYDYDTYIDGRGFYIDYKKEMPGVISNDISKILDSIKNVKYDYLKLENFRKKYVIDTENCTKEIANLIVQ